MLSLGSAGIKGRVAPKRKASRMIA
jgi:hypothetical protein